jgi:hypothetical protein
MANPTHTNHGYNNFKVYVGHRTPNIDQNAMASCNELHIKHILLISY